VGFTATGTDDATDATPTPGGPGVDYVITYHFTKVTGAIVGSIILVGIIILCIIGKRKRKRAEHKRVAERASHSMPPGPGGFYPGSRNSFDGMPSSGVMIYSQQHEIMPLPPIGAPPPQEYPVPAYQIFRPRHKGLVMNIF